MDWLRWYNGTTADPKFQVVARKSGQPAAFVLAVWAMLLERASAADDRGSVAGFDCEAADVLIGAPDGAACAIVQTMQAREMIVNDRIAKWECRQPKREREDKSTGRVQAYRSRQATAQDGVTADVTPCNTMKRHETPRVEENREDINTGTPNGVLVGDDAADQPTDSADEPNSPTSRNPDCQLNALIEAYHDELPGHPRVEVVNEARRKHAKARWADAAKRLRAKGSPVTRDALLEYFRRYFHHAAQSEFLTGRVHSRDRPPFMADFDFLVSAKGFVGVIEGKYHQRGLLQ